MTTNNTTENLQPTFDKINEQIMEHHLKPVRRIYIDINALKDTKLGLLIFLYKDNPEIMKYLEDNLDRYNKRITRNFTDVFNELTFTESELLDKYQDPLLSTDIFNHSPDTDLMYQLPKYMTTLQHSNSQRGFYEKIFITINLNPLVESDLINRFVTILNQILPEEHFVIKTIYSEYTEISESFWTTFDIIILDDIKEAIKSGLGEGLITKIDEQNFADKKIYAPFSAEQEAIDKWLEEGLDLTDESSIREKFELTTIYFKICCDFQFLPYLIPINNEVANG